MRRGALRAVLFAVRRGADSGSGNGVRSERAGYTRLSGRVYRLLSEVRVAARPREPLGILVFRAVVLYRELFSETDNRRCFLWPERRFLFQFAGRSG